MHLKLEFALALVIAASLSLTILLNTGVLTSYSACFPPFQLLNDSSIHMMDGQEEWKKIVQSYREKLRTSIVYRNYHQIGQARTFFAHLTAEYDHASPGTSSNEMLGLQANEYLSRISVVGAPIAPPAPAPGPTTTPLQLLFSSTHPLVHIIHGFPSPYTMQLLGARYQLPLDSLLGHLRFPDQGDSLCMHQSLPSEGKQVLTIKLVSLARSPTCLHGTDSGTATASANQARVDTEMSDFLRSLYQSIPSGRTQYRKVTIHGPWHFSVEGHISILLVRHDSTPAQPEPQYTTILMSDYGGSAPPHHPWDVFRNHHASIDATFYPINERRFFPATDPATTTTTTSHPPTKRPLPNPFSSRAHRKQPQPLQPTTPTDQTTLVTDILSTAAMSWSQLLDFLGNTDLVAHDAAKSTTTTTSEEQAAQLARNQRFLMAAVSHFDEILAFLRLWGVSPSTAEESTATALPHNLGNNTNAISTLIVDYTYLRTQATSLSANYSAAINALLSTMNIREAQRTIAQGARVQQLTILALIFAPASFAAGCFSTNIVELREPRIWQFLLTILVLSALASLGVFWNDWGRFYGRVRRWLF